MSPPDRWILVTVAVPGPRSCSSAPSIIADRFRRCRSTIRRVGATTPPRTSRTSVPAAADGEGARAPRRRIVPPPGRSTTADDTEHEGNDDDAALSPCRREPVEQRGSSGTAPQGSPVLVPGADPRDPPENDTRLANADPESGRSSGPSWPGPRAQPMGPARMATGGGRIAGACRAPPFWPAPGMLPAASARADHREDPLRDASCRLVGSLDVAVARSPCGTVRRG